MFSLGGKKDDQALSKWSSGDETGMFHTMHDDINALGGKGSKSQQPEPIEAPKPYLERPFSRPVTETPNLAPSGNSPFMATASVPVSQPAEAPKFTAKDEKKAKILTQKEADTPDQYLTSGLKLDHPEKSRSFSFGKLLLVISVILIAAGAFLWGYTLWMERQGDGTEETTETPEENVNPENKPNEQIVEEIPQWTNKFSANTPNYWIIPVETMTADGMTKVINDKAAEAASLNDGDLAEFLITDSNNNPVSFSAFCILSGIILPSQTFDSLEDSFSFYFYKDSDKVRAGLSAKVKNPDKIIPLLSGVEKNMLVNFNPLLLNDAATSKAVKFSDSKYKSHSIRFFNLTASGDASIDYSVTQNYLVIGTSMNTGRAILDKVAP